jgi:Superinfection immunity protein
MTPPTASDGFTLLAVLFWILAVWVPLYFLPWGIAWGRVHPQRRAIFVLNLLAGWSIVGWIVAAVWACMAFQSKE